MNSPSPLQILAIGLVGLFLLIVFLFFNAGKQEDSYKNVSPSFTSTPPSTSIPTSISKSENQESKYDIEKKERLSKEKNIIDKFFSAQKKGLSGEDYFCDKDFVTTFFAVRNYEIVDDLEGIGINYTVRVESSTRGGIPIIKLWSISVLEEKGKYCISIISEK